MSTTKEKREKEEVTTKVTSPSTSTTSNTTTSSQIQQEEQRYAVNRALDETKDNIRKTTDEARRDIPRYTQAVNEYHEQTIQAPREITDNYLDSQKEIINSYQSAWLPQIEATNRAFVSSWMSPRQFVDNYARVVSSFADNSIAATRVANNAIFVHMETTKILMQNTRDNTKELSRIGVNAPKTLEQTSRDTSRVVAGQDTYSSFSPGY